MITAFTRSVAQLGDRAILAVLAKTLALTLVIFLAAGGLLWWGIDAALGHWSIEAGGLAAAAATLVLVLAAWLLFRAVAIAVLNLFAEDVVIAVEQRHYPDALASARAPGWHRAMAMSLRSLVRAILVNLVALPLYVLLLVTGIGTAIAFAVVNAWLLGRDLGEMVAARHMPAAAIRPWLTATRGRRMLLGLVVTGLFVVPLVNLLAPVIGAAMATHAFHGGWRRWE